MQQTPLLSQEHKVLSGASSSGVLPRGDSAPHAGRKIACGVAENLDAPEEVLYDVDYIVGEILTNALRYGLGDVILYQITGTDHRIEMEYRYNTEQFDLYPPEPDILAEHGRGILSIRAMCEAADPKGGSVASWLFVPDGVVVTVVRSW